METAAMIEILAWLAMAIALLGALEIWLKGD